MFEARTLAGPHANHVPADPDWAEGLRPIAWAELTAKFTAARDLRRVALGVNRGTVSSFDQDAARQLHTLGHGKPDVNPDGLGNSKDGAVIALGGKNAGIGDRGSK